MKHIGQHFIKLTVNILTSFILIYFLDVTVAVLDLNPQQIQYVADHLTDKKCERLLDALRQTGFQLKPFHLTSTSTSASANAARRQHRHRPCVVQLSLWANGPGQDLTFDFLALRLKEIGLPKVADRLSESVLHETSRELHEFFLDDPFKNMVPTDSVMVDMPDSTTQLLPPVDARDKDDKLFVTVIILLVILSTFGLFVGVCLACPRAGHFVCLRACPSSCSVCYELVVDGCQNVWRGSKSAVDTYLFVSPVGGDGGFMV